MADDHSENSETATDFKLIKIDLDERSLARATADIEYERKIAVYDLLEDNCFQPIGAGNGPFELFLSIVERRLVFEVRAVGGEKIGSVHLSLMPLRKVIKDYFCCARVTTMPFVTRPRRKLRRSIWRGAACIMKARTFSKSGWKTKSSSTTILRGDSSP